MKFVFGLFFQVITLSALSQMTVVSADKMNILYTGIENPLTIGAENCPCHELFVESTRGKIKGKGCYYTYFPDTIGYTEQISIYRKIGKNKSLLGVSSFTVKQIPLPELWLESHENSFGNSKYLKIQKQDLISLRYAVAKNML